jgi:hypothetical protein
MEDQIIMAILSVIEQVMSILAAEESGSSSAQRSKRRRRYVNYDRKAAHLKLHHDYFSHDCVYPVILLLKVPYAKNSFPKHYEQA